MSQRFPSGLSAACAGRGRIRARHPENAPAIVSRNPGVALPVCRQQRARVIASVAFRNFRALRSARLELGLFNLLIGPNGSGKTSLIDAILRLRSLAESTPQSLADASPEREEIAFQFSPPHDGTVARLGCLEGLVCDGIEIEPAGAPGWPALQKEIARIRQYALDHTALAAPSPRDEAAELRPDGANLAAVLARRRASAPDSYDALTAEMLRIMPEFQGLELSELPGGRLALGLVLVEDGVVPAAELSQGTLYLLGVLTLAFDPSPPSVVCFEEIDRGIHPRLLREIRDALYRLSYPAAFGLQRPPVQVVATTQSPYLIDLFREHPEEVVIAQKHGRAAVFERLSDRADLPELLREGSLGDMWYSGVLGGVPDER